MSDSGVVCFDEATMAEQWRALQDEHSFEPVITSTALLVGGTTGLHALNLSDGTRRWRWHRGEQVFSPAADSNTVYATDRAGRVAALDLESGAVKWQRKLDGWLYTPALVEDRVITGGQAATVYALDRETGETIWTRDLDQELVYRPVALEEGVVLTTFRGTIVKLSPAGDLLWRGSDPSPSFSPVEAAGDLLVFGGMDGLLRARDRGSGELRWTVELSGQLAVPARAHENRVAVVSPDGELAVIDAADGSVLRRTPVPGAPVAGPVRVEPGVWRLFHRRWGIITWADASIR